MIKSLHIGRYVAKPEDFRTLVKFLDAIGLDRAERSSDSGRSTIFSAPLGLLSVNSLPEEYTPEVVKRLKDVAKLIVLEVSNPASAFDVAQKMKLKILSDGMSKDGRRSFSVELPGDVIVTLYGVPGDAAAVAGRLDAQGLRFAVVVARFNAFITERLLEGALDGLLRSGARREDVAIVRVPGSFEIPQMARSLAETGRFDAVICIGCLLRGGTAHYDVIVNEVARGIGQSSQETGVPHALGVLTCDTLEQAIDRAGLKMGNKGFEAALAAIEMANAKKAVSHQPSAVKKNSKAAASQPRRSHRRAVQPGRKGH
jgi:6,7-dimethyl-8-ribityllumazine synthase